MYDQGSGLDEEAGLPVVPVSIVPVSIDILCPSEVYLES